MERTFGIIKPNSINNAEMGKIITRIEDAGFKFVTAKFKTLTKSEAEGFYAEHKDRPFFNSLITFMTSGPVLLFVLEAPDSVAKWRTLMGATDPAKAAPGTIRAVFADSLEANSVHGSDSQASATREITYFFKEEL